MVELHVYLIRDGRGHIVVNHTGQARGTIAKHSQSQRIVLVFDEVVAQAIGLCAQAVNANGRIGARAFCSCHIKRGVTRKAVVEGADQNFIGACVRESEFRITACRKIFSTFHCNVFFEVVEEIRRAEVFFIVDDVHAAVACVILVLADDSVRINCKLEFLAVEGGVEINDQCVHLSCTEALVIGPESNHERRTIGVLNDCPV